MDRINKYRKAIPQLFCTSVIKRFNPIYTKEDIIAGIKEMGYNTVEAMYYYNIIEEVKKRGLMQRNGEDD